MGSTRAVTADGDHAPSAAGRARTPIPSRSTYPEDAAQREREGARLIQVLPAGPLRRVELYQRARARYWARAGSGRRCMRRCLRGRIVARGQERFGLPEWPPVGSASIRTGSAARPQPDLV